MSEPLKPRPIRRNDIISRFEGGYVAVPCSHGNWVHYDDHLESESALLDLLVRAADELRQKRIGAAGTEWPMGEVERAIRANPLVAERLRKGETEP